MDWKTKCKQKWRYDLDCYSMAAPLSHGCRRKQRPSPFRAPGYPFMPERIYASLCSVKLNASGWCSLTATLLAQETARNLRPPYCALGLATLLDTKAHKRANRAETISFWQVWHTASERQDHHEQQPSGSYRWRRFERTLLRAALRDRPASPSTR